SAARQAGQARDDGWSHEEYLAAVCLHWSANHRQARVRGTVGQSNSTRWCPPSGNMWVAHKQFLLGPRREGLTTRFWADCDLIHISIGGGADQDGALPPVEHRSGQAHRVRGSPGRARHHDAHPSRSASSGTPPIPESSWSPTRNVSLGRTRRG